MTLVKWLGGDGEPDTTVWNGVTFKRGVPVQVADAWMVEKARGNRFFEVIEGEDRMAKARAARAEKRRHRM